MNVLIYKLCSKKLQLLRLQALNIKFKEFGVDMGAIKNLLMECDSLKKENEKLLKENAHLKERLLKVDNSLPY